MTIAWCIVLIAIFAPLAVQVSKYPVDNANDLFLQVAEDNRCG